MNGTDPPESDAQPVLACLGVASRFRLVRALAVADRCVGELADAVGLSQSCTTRHLQALERVGLVKGRREGRRVRFSLRAEASGLGELLGWALSGSALEAPPAGEEHRARWSVAMSADRSMVAKPEQTARRARRAGRPRPRDEAERAPAAYLRPSGPAGSHGSEDANPEPFAVRGPVRRPDDLEDYLL